MTENTPPTRADARRNRQAVLDAAREVFAEQGVDAPLDLIAQRAGVGNATLYRHFPNRCELVAATLRDHVAVHAELAEAAAAHPDPWVGLNDYLHAACRLQLTSRGLAEILADASVRDPELDALRRRAHRSLVRLVRRARTAGALRPEIRPGDLSIVLQANFGIVSRGGRNSAAASSRLVSIVLEGLAAR